MDVPPLACREPCLVGDHALPLPSGCGCIPGAWAKVPGMAFHHGCRGCTHGCTEYAASAAVVCGDPDRLGRFRRAADSRLRWSATGSIVAGQVAAAARRA